MVEEREEPKLRFPGFADPWEQRKFGDVLETVTDYVAAGSFADLAKNVEYRDKPDFAQLVRTMDLKNGFTSSQEVFVDENAFHYLYRVNLDKECIILPNIGNCGEVYFVRPEALPYQHNVLGPNAIYVRSETNNNLFLSTLFQAKDFQTKLSLIVSPNGQTKFNKTELKQIELVLPSSETEQNKIGGLFEMVDEAIILHQRKRDEVKALKNAMLQKMFPKEGEAVPEIRFPGFAGDWERHKLVNVVDVYDGTHQTPKYQDHGVMFVSVEDIQTLSSKKYISEEDYKRNYSVVPEQGDILMTRIGDIGTANVIKTAESLAYYVSLALLKNKGINAEFLKANISAPAFQNELWLRTLHTAYPKKINKDEIGKCMISIAPTTDEQEQIGMYFNYLDNLITLHQHKCDELKELKKGLLQQMFV